MRTPPHFNTKIIYNVTAQWTNLAQYNIVQYSVPEHSHSAGGVIWHLYMELFPWDFHIHTVDSALTVEENSYSSISYKCQWWD